VAHPTDAVIFFQKKIYGSGSSAGRREEETKTASENFRVAAALMFQARSSPLAFLRQEEKRVARCGGFSRKILRILPSKEEEALDNEGVKGGKSLTNFLSE